MLVHLSAKANLLGEGEDQILGDHLAAEKQAQAQFARA
jgi:hypothetical protein